MRWLLIAGLAGVMASGCKAPAATEDAGMPAPSAEPAPPPQVADRLPANAELVLRLDSVLSSTHSRVGDLFTASLEQDYTARNGEVILPAGTKMTGMVTGIDASERAGDAAAIRLNFLRINIGGVNHPLSAVIVSTRLEAGGGTDADREAGTDAAWGRVIREDAREATLGEGLGAGAGSIVGLGTGDVTPVLPVGLRLVVRTRDELELR